LTAQSFKRPCGASACGAWLEECASVVWRIWRLDRGRAAGRKKRV